MRAALLLSTLVLCAAGCRAGGGGGGESGGGEPRGAAPGLAHPNQQPLLGLGRPATTNEIKAWDIDVGPDGTGLPPGSGTARQGAVLYQRKCAGCHGRSGTEGPSEPLVGRDPRQGFPFGRNPSLVRTIGNYWPYATTLYD